MKKPFTSLIAVMLLFSTGAADALAQAQAPDRIQCAADIDASLAQQQRIYRSVLFGLRPAATEDTGNTRYTEDGTAWIKTGQNAWRTAAAGYVNTTITNAQVDQRTEWAGMNGISNAALRQRPGIFETKGVLTSELLEPLIQSRRALDCRTAAVCELVRQSRIQAPDPGGYLTVHVRGCDDMRMPALQSCAFHNPVAGAVTGFIDAAAEQMIADACEPARQDLLMREDAVLRLAVTYDAAYRSLLQFAGNFDAFLGDFNGSVLTPISDSMSILNHLSRLPCFISQCNG